MPSFNLFDLYNQVWGVSPISIVGRAAITAQDTAGIAVNDAIWQSRDRPAYDFTGIEIMPASSPIIATSALGIPITEQITFKVPVVKNGSTVISKAFNYQLPGWPLFDITGSNVIEKTPQRGGKGNIKEYIYEDDWQVTIRGFLINETDDSYPTDALQQFMKLINAKTDFEVVSEVMNVMNIHNLVIERWSLPTIEGFPTIQPFELNCLSDSPEEIVITSVMGAKKITQGI